MCGVGVTESEESGGRHSKRVRQSVKNVEAEMRCDTTVYSHSVR